MFCFSFGGLDLDAARRVAGNGFYYLMGDIARLHSAVISYARDFMIGRGFTYCVPPFMIRSDVVTGVMSFAEMDAMMYKIEGERTAFQRAHRDIERAEQIHRILPEPVKPYRRFLRLADHNHLLLLKLVNAVHASFLDAVRALLLA